ncbi:MAG: class I SAM-dependent methyltransferase [Anaerolineae bacterium]|nr:class I SAM-dependent methyltransferase [Anaerolineae bacterium]
MNDLRAFFEDLATRWDAQQPHDRQEVLRLLLAPFAAELGAAQAILEIGCGTGALVPCLRERAPAVRLVSIDLAHAMLWRAWQRCPGAVLVQADVHRLPFALPGGAAAFDLAVCHNSFPHFADAPSALRELARVLVPGGFLLVLHDLGREQVNAIHSRAGPPVQHDWLPPGEEMRRLLRQGGFRGLQVQDAADRYVAVGRRNGGR